MRGGAGAGDGGGREEGEEEASRDVISGRMRQGNPAGKGKLSGNWKSFPKKVADLLTNRAFR